MYGNNMQQGMAFGNNNIDNNPNMFLNNNNVNMGNNNMMNNFQMNFNSPNLMNHNMMFNNNINMPDLTKMQINFKTTDDKIFTITVDCEMSVDDLLKQYCKEFGHPDYIGTYNKIKFIYKAGLLRFEDKTPLIMKFMSREPQKIIVHDVSSVIG